MEWRKKLNLAILFTGVILSAVSYTMPFAIFPNQALSRGVSVSQSGLVLGSSYIVTFLCTPICGKLIGRFGVKRIYLTGILIIGISNIIFGFLEYIDNGAIYFWLALSLRILSAVGESVALPASYPLGAQQFEEGDRGKAIAITEATFGIGAALGPSLGGFLKHQGGFTLPFWVVGGGFVLTTILLIFPFKSEKIQKKAEDRVTSWKEIILCPGIMAYGLATLIAGTSNDWFNATMEPHLFEQFGSSSAEIGLVLMTYSIAYTIGAPAVGVIIDRGFSCLWAVLVGHLCISVSFLFLGPVPGLEYHPVFQNIPVKFIALFVQGIGSALTFIGTLLGMEKCSVKGNLPKTEQTHGMVSGMWLLTVSLGSFIGASSGSAIYDVAGFSWSCTTEAILMGLSIPLIYILVRCAPRIKTQRINNIQQKLAEMCSTKTV